MATTLIFNSNFETGTLTQQGWDEVNSGSADSSIVLASSEGITAHGGADIAKQANTSGSGEAGTRLQFYGLNYDQDFIYEWYDYYPAVMSYTVSGGNWGPQLFGFASTDINGVNGPVWSFGPKLVGGVMKAELVWKPSGWTPIGNGPLATDDSSTKWYTSDVTMPTGQWVKWRVEVRPAGDFTGYLRWYMNDTLLWEFENCKTTVPDSGQRALYGDWVMLYSQHTMYGQGLNPQPCIRYLDDVSIWSVDRTTMLNQAVETNIAHVILADDPPVFSPVVRAFRVYFNNGGEATATPAAAENANYTIFDGQALHIRFSVQEEGGVTGGAAIWGTRQSRNGSAFSSMGGSTIWLEAFPTDNITDNEATTQRLSSGTGSFVAGVADDVNGAVTKQLTANNFTEFLYSIWMDSVNSVLVPGDVMTIKLSCNGVDIPNNFLLELTVIDPTGIVEPLAQASDAEVAQALSASKTLALAQVTETETAAALGKLKLKGFAAPLETDSAQAFASKKLQALLLASDAEQALEIQSNVAHSLGLVLESESAQQITAIKTKLLNPAHDFEVAREMLLGGAPAPEAPFFIDLTTGQIYWRVGKFIIPL